MLPMIFAALLAVSASTIVAAHETPSLNVSSAPGRIIVAQELSIPTDAQLERMEERAITTNPLDDSEAPALRGGEGAENRQMDRRAHRIDEQLLTNGGICAGC